MKEIDLVGAQILLSLPLSMQQCVNSWVAGRYQCRIHLAITFVLTLLPTLTL